MINKQFLVDTSIWIKCFREDNKSLQTQISSLILGKRVFTSEIIILEILRGAKSDKEYNSLYEDFLALPLLEINRKVWETAWKIAYKLRKKGVNAPLTDVLISGVALYYKCHLIHSDKHFNLISKLTDLKTMEL